MSKGLGETANAVDGSSVSVARTGVIEENIGATGSYSVECYDAEGNLKWSDTIKNLVVTVGKNDLLDKYFAGSSYTAAWYMGLVDNTSFSAYAAGDTLASHAGWLEFLSYTGTNRTTVAWNAASAGSKASTTTAFNINGSGTVLGALMCTTQAKNTASNGGAGILYSAGSFTGGARTVASGDVLNVTYTASV
jgi:hypothetical protein